MHSRWIAIALPILLVSAGGCENEQEGTPLNPAGTRQQEEPVPQADEPEGNNGAREAQSRESHTATGEVESIDPQAGQITIAHDPVESLAWPEMTMPFSVQDPRLLKGIEAGTKIEFTFREGPAGEYTIEEIRER